jgi:flagellar hook-basal body complex protein FliE
MAQMIQSISPLSITDNIKQPENRQADGSDFFSILQQSLNDVNEQQKAADKAVGEIATGQVKDLHQAAIAIDKAEISMKVMLEVRNKAINAYKELSKTQI